VLIPCDSGHASLDNARFVWVSLGRSSSTVIDPRGCRHKVAAALENLERNMVTSGCH
jgi:hypothetical protein